MKPSAIAPVLVCALAATGLAHGGAYAPPPSNGGPPAAPGFGGGGDGSGVATKWETWWAESREDLLRIAERVDSVRLVAVTPKAGEKLGDKDPATNRATAAAQVREEILGHLLYAINQDDFDVRSSAAIALGKLGHEMAEKPLERCAHGDSRPEVRRAALFGLGILGRKESLPFLCRLITDRNAEMDERGVAVLAVGLVGGDESAEFLSFFLERDTTRPDPKSGPQAQLIATTYAALGMTNSIEALRTLWCAADDDAASPFLRAHAVLGLARAKDHDSAARFVKLLEPSGDPQLRRAAVAALGRIVRAEDDDVVRALTALVTTDRDLIARRLAIRGLAEVRTPAVRSLLRGQFKATSDIERPYLAMALGVQRDAVSAPAIREALKVARDESARAAYCIALGLIGDKDSVAALEGAIGPGPMPGTYRGFAALALAVVPSVESADALWKRFPQENDARVWGDYAIALGLLGDTRVHGFLSAALKGGDGNFAKCRAASCLGVLRRADAVPELAAMLRDVNVDGVVRSLCTVALGQIGDVSVVPKLTRVSAGCDLTLSTPAIAEALTIL